MKQMTYDAALEKLAALGPELPPSAGDATRPPRKFTLDHIATLLNALGNPQRMFPSVLIAGTNGKGSTAATLASITNAAGLKTGLYTSPHLLRVNERLRVSGGEGLDEVSDEDFALAFERVDEAATTLVTEGTLPHYPSFFELMTAMAFCHFAGFGEGQKVDLAVLEVGLGGRLDATNVVEPVVSVITDIAMDHMEYLGNTLGEIAREKAGILRENGVLVTLSQHPLANQAIGEAAMGLNVRGVDASRYLPPRGYGAGAALAHNAYPVSIDGEVVSLDSPLAGQHQQRNLALAVAAAVELRTNHGFTISNAAIERGVAVTAWPGRLEMLRAASGGGSAAAYAPLLLDVAHNPAGAWTLRAELAKLPEEMPRTLIFSCLRDKQLGELAQVLFPLFDAASADPLRAVILAPIQNARAATLEELMAAAHAMDVPAHAAPHLPAALQQARQVTPAEGIIVATGSVFLVGELRALALGER